MQKVISQVLLQGTSEDYLDHVNRRLIYSNIVYVTLPIVYVIFVLIEIDSFLIPIGQMKWDQFIFLVEIFVCICGVYLNKIGYSFIGKIIFLITWPFLLHIIPIWQQHSPNDYYFAYPVGITFHSMLIQLMISRKYEPIPYYILMVSNFFLLLFSIDMLVYFSDHMTSDFLKTVTSRIYFHVCILYWLLFSMATFFLTNSIDKLFAKIEDDQFVIKEQKEELQSMNEELKASNDALNELNNSISNTNLTLEDAVIKRTKRIEEQNKKLREYAFLNAHKLRAPFCRIKGLLSLNQIINENEKPQIERMLMLSIDELEQVISEIQDIVKENQDGLN